MRLLFFIAFLNTSVFGLVAQELTKVAPVDVYVFDWHKKLKASERITLFNKEYRFSGVTDSTGKFRVNLQGGEEYMVMIHGFGYEENYTTFKVPDARPGATYPVSRLKISYDKPIPIPKHALYYDTGLDSLTRGQKKSLKGIADYMSRYPDVVLSIKGHTDNVGTNSSNIQLSLRRAESVERQLVFYGVSVNRMRVQAYGETRPEESNNDENGRAQNRRVELSIHQ